MGPGTINTVTTVCLLMEKVGKTDQDATLQAYTELARPVFDAAKAEKKDPSMAFCVAMKSDEVTKQIGSLRSSVSRKTASTSS